MRITLALVALLYSTAVMAQASPPPAAGSPPPTATASSSPTVGEQPLLQVKPRGKKAAAVPASSTSSAKKLQACLEIDDGTKGRLDCYDAIFPPKPNPKAKPAQRVMDCHFIKEEDDRLNCYNGFAEKIPKF